MIPKSINLRRSTSRIDFEIRTTFPFCPLLRRVSLGWEICSTKCVLGKDMTEMLLQLWKVECLPHRLPKIGCAVMFFQWFELLYLFAILLLQIVRDGLWFILAVNDSNGLINLCWGKRVLLERCDLAFSGGNRISMRVVGWMSQFCCEFLGFLMWSICSWRSACWCHSVCWKPGSSAKNVPQSQWTRMICKAYLWPSVVRLKSPPSVVTKLYSSRFAINPADRFWLICSAPAILWIVARSLCVLIMKTYLVRPLALPGWIAGGYVSVC